MFLRHSRFLFTYFNLVCAISNQSWDGAALKISHMIMQMVGVHMLGLCSDNNVQVYHKRACLCTSTVLNVYRILENENSSVLSCWLLAAIFVNTNPHHTILSHMEVENKQCALYCGL